MVWQRAAVIAALFVSALCGPAEAQDVTLTSRDGSVEISGTLLGYDGEFYRVDTRFGELTVDGSGVSCEGPGCPSLTDFVAEVAFSGSSVMAEGLLPALVEGFALRNGYRLARETLDDTHFAYRLSQPESDRAAGQFVFRVTNTDEGFADLLANEADIVLALREIRPDEKALARDAGMGDMTGAARSRVLALDAMVPIVAPDNPVKAITPLQLARVFAGEVQSWAELEGPDSPIFLHLPEAGFGLSQAAEDTLLAPARLVLSPSATRHDVSSAVVEAVIDDPFAIGLASFSETGDAKVLPLSGGCGYTLAATRRSIKTEDYPLTAPMFLYLPARRLPKLGREFLGYIKSPAAQVVIRRAGFVDQIPEEVGIGLQGERLANAILAAGPEVSLELLQQMTGELKNLSRLTISFRFEPGSARPDAQSRANIMALSDALQSGQYDARRLVFVGFSDGQGSAEANARIARARAQAVRRAVLNEVGEAAARQVRIDVQAYGEALPMACDETEWGRKANRRVEVWLE